MPTGVTPKHTTICGTCKKRVGARHKGFSNHRSTIRSEVQWKTAPHDKCPGGSISISADQVDTRQ